MGIAFECACGHAMTAADAWAGLSARCPACGAWPRVPPRREATFRYDPDADEDGVGLGAAAPATAPAVPRPSAESARRHAAPAAAVPCAACGESLPVGEAVWCVRCRAAHHAACGERKGGCAVPTCDAGPRSRMRVLRTAEREAPARPCPRCGLSAPAHAKRCRQCGAVLAGAQADAGLRCPACRTAVKPGARRCAACGTSLAGGLTAARRRGDARIGVWAVAAAAVGIVTLLRAAYLIGEAARTAGGRWEAALWSIALNAMVIGAGAWGLRNIRRRPDALKGGGWGVGAILLGGIGALLSIIAMLQF